MLPEVCSCAALRQASRHVTRLYDEALASTGLSLNQYTILSKLDREGGSAIQALADRLVMDRSTLGHLLRPLERRNALTMGRASEDGRRRVVTLTVDGRRLLAEARLLWEAAEQRFQAAVGRGEAAALRDAMRRLTATDFRREPVEDAEDGGSAGPPDRLAGP